MLVFTSFVLVMLGVLDTLGSRVKRKHIIFHVIYVYGI